MTSTTTSPMRVRAPAEILAVVPYLLGFHPADSLVLIGLRGKKMAFNARGDLPVAGTRAADIAELARYYGEILRRQRLDGALLVGYGAEDRVTPLLTAVRDVLEGAGVAVPDALRVADGRYWSYVCRNADCCPPDGTSFEVTTSAVAAAATMAGFVALPDRATVVRSLDPPSGLALIAIEQATDRAEDRFNDMYAREDCASALLADGEAAIGQACDRYGSGGRLTDDELAWLAVLLALTPVRDAAWQRVDKAGRNGRAIHERLWTDVLRRCDPTLAAPPGMLLAYTLWRDGDGLRAGVAVDRALAADPGYSAALLMREVLSRAVPPSALERHGARRRRPARHRSSRQPSSSSKAGRARHRRRR
jgi:Domain of unknown function (DUF4192)